MKVVLSLCFLLGAATAAKLELEDFRSLAERVNSLGTTWKADHEFPSHLSASSIQGLLGAWKSDNILPENDEDFEDENDIIPEEFDARKKWPECPTISEIADQSRCGSCWAVAAATAFADRVCIATKGKFKAQLSATELLSCCNTCGDGCQGGYPSEAWNYFKKSGISTGGGFNSSQGCQPYPFPRCGGGELPPCSSLPDYETPECHKECTNPSYQGSFKQDHHKVRKVYSLRTSESIQRDIMRYGPVEAAFTVYSDFMTYKSGVYQHTAGRPLLGHAVRVIGWGKENGTPYWLVANSWDKYWGEGGLFRILRGQNECDFEDEVVAGIPAV